MTTAIPEWLLDVPFKLDHLPEDGTDSGIYRVRLIGQAGEAAGIGDSVADAAEAAREMLASLTASRLPARTLVQLSLVA